MRKRAYIAVLIVIVAVVVGIIAATIISSSGNENIGAIKTSVTYNGKTWVEGEGDIAEAFELKHEEDSYRGYFYDDEGDFSVRALDISGDKNKNSIKIDGGLYTSVYIETTDYDNGLIFTINGEEIHESEDVEGVLDKYDKDANLYYSNGTGLYLEDGKRVWLTFYYDILSRVDYYYE